MGDGRATGTDKDHPRIRAATPQQPQHERIKLGFLERFGCGVVRAVHL